MRRRTPDVPERTGSPLPAELAAGPDPAVWAKGAPSNLDAEGRSKWALHRWRDAGDEWARRNGVPSWEWRRLISSTVDERFGVSVRARMARMLREDATDVRSVP